MDGIVSARLAPYAPWDHPRGPVASVWSGVFGNDRPVEIEIGPGRGDVLLAFARACPQVNFFAIEHVHGAAERIAERIADAGLPNARVLAGDAACVVRNLVPPASVAAYHIYFPDPWPKRRHHKRRLVTPSFVATLGRTLAPGGLVHVATDLDWLFDAMVRALAQAHFVACDAPPAPARPTTHFERKYASAGTFAGAFAPPA
jgi:tRNA (guanine-N7-)-methyltransferase